MGDNAGPNPQLAAILETLAQFSTPTGRAPQPEIALASAPPTNHIASSSDVPDRRSQLPPAPSQRSTPQPQIRKTTPPPPSIDPSKIVDFPTATKYMMKTLSRNLEASAKLQRTIKNQHDNEKTWWAGREAILTKHQERVHTRQEVSDVLRALGTVNRSDSNAVPALSTTNPSADDERAEIQRYDAKVYAALRQMVKAIDNELKALGVPFFAISHDLVYDGEVGKTGTVSTEELRGLQQRMLELLQDMFGD